MKETKTQEERIDELSQQLFNKPAKEIKYVLITDFVHTQLLKENLIRTGLYQWQLVFRGEVRPQRDILDYNEYDIVQVNMSTQDLHLIEEIRRQINTGGKTKLVVNNDYTTEMWSKTFHHPTVLANAIKGADMIFGTEYYQTSALAELTGRQCFIIPHPADIKRLKSLKKLKQKNIISTIWRRYDNHAYIPSLVVRNHGLTTQLVGYDKNIDAQRGWLTTSMYDYAIGGTNCADFQDQLRESKIVYDPFTYHSYNRSIVECAAMGIPVVGSDRTQSIKMCYPFTAVDPYDVTSARRLIEKLLTDEAFNKKVVAFAKEKSEVYNHENSIEKYLTALIESQVDEPPKEIKRPKKVEKVIGKDVNIDISEEKTKK